MNIYYVLYCHSTLQIGSFLPNPRVLEDPSVKKLTLALVNTAKQVSLLEEIEETNPVLATSKAVFYEVIENGCDYVSKQRQYIFSDPISLIFCHLVAERGTGSDRNELHIGRIDFPANPNPTS